MKAVLKAMYIVGTFIGFIGCGLASNQGEAHQSGQAFASSLMGSVTGAAQSTNPHVVPGFQTDKPEETDLDSGALGEAAFQAATKSEAAQHIISQAKDRKSFKINPDTDPLFTTASEVIANPQKTLDEEIVEAESIGSPQEETKLCEEAGDETLEECEEFRVVKVNMPDRLDKHRVTLRVCSDNWSNGLSRNVITGVGTNPHSGSGTYLTNPLPANLIPRAVRAERVPEFIYAGVHCSFNSLTTGGGWFGGLTEAALWEGHMRMMSSFNADGTFFMSTYNAHYASGLRIDGIVLNFDIFYKALPKEEDVTEVIDNNCQYLEEKVEKGLCSYEDITIIEGPQTRVINDYPVTRDWWRRKKIYRCHYPAKNDCEALRAKSCYQVNSTCKEKVKDTCVVWQQTYKCPSGKISGKSYHSSNKSNPFCLTGNCADASYEANGEMMNVISQLSVLREVQEDLRNYKVIFKGNGLACTRHCVGFKDCCGSDRGWGVSTGLAKCDKDEQELRKLRDKNLCIQVGTYCAEKKLGVCIRKKTSFCCYGTKMARLIQQNGRAQLGRGFGSPQSPDCEGLSADEMSQIDFSRIDFSEVFEDIRNKMVPKGQEQSLAQVSTKRIQENMTLLTKPSLNAQTQASTQELKEKGF